MPQTHAIDKQTPLSADRQRLLALRLKGTAKPPLAASRIAKRPAEQHIPLSFAQHQLWVIDQMTPGNPGYNVPAAYRIRGALDLPLLEKSFNQIIERHEIWRTTFHEIDGDAVQEIHPECTIRICVTHLDQTPPEDREGKVRELIAREAVQPFDLCQLPLLRIALFELDQDDHVLMVNFHHIVGDGVSLNLMFEELDAIYRAALSHTLPRLPELTVQYADFAAWQKADGSMSQRASQLDYWRRQLKGDLPLLEFAVEKPRPPHRSFDASSVNFSLPKSLVERLTSVGNQEGCTLFVMILAAAQVILHRYSKAEEIVVGTPIANRDLPEVERSIGNFVNMVALRCDLHGEPTFLELLRRSKETALNALTNKDIPFEMLVNDLRSHRNPSHSPIFQLLLQVLPAGHAGIGDLSVSEFDFELKSTQADLALHLRRQAGGEILGLFQYCTALFTREAMEGLSRNFVQLLDEICTDPHRKILEIPIPELPLAFRGQSEEPPLLEGSGQAGPRRGYAPPELTVQSQLIEIWEEVLHRSPIGIHDDFFELGGHSLLVARMLSIAEARLGVRLPFGAFFKEATIEHMAVLMMGRQQLPVDQSWVALNENGTKAPFFFLHGDYNGGGFFCRSLARYSGEDRPFYAMHPAGLHGDPVPSTIEEMAALKLQELRKIQPEGPYLLGGYCNGALVAYEMARRIEAEGGKAPLVIMLVANGANMRWPYLKRAADLIGALRRDDAEKRHRRFLRWRENFKFLSGVRDHYVKAAADLIKHPPAEQVRRIARKTRRVFLRLRGKAPAPIVAPNRAPHSHGCQNEFDEIKGNAYFDAFFDYRPKRFGGRIILLWPEDEISAGPQGPAYGWTGVCGDIQLELVPGEHTTCIGRDPNLQIIGRKISRALAAIEARDSSGA